MTLRNAARLLLLTASFLSTGFAEGWLFYLVFLERVYRKTYIDCWEAFGFSLLMDLYSFAFVGITYLSIATLYLLPRRLKPVFPNFKMNLGYFFMAFSCCKIPAVVLTYFMGYGADLYSVLQHWFWPLSIYIICYPLIETYGAFRSV